MGFCRRDGTEAVMCGILGILAKQPRDELGVLGFRVGQTLRHRGPDDHGWLLAGPGGVCVGQNTPPARPGQIFLMHQRLSILDLSAAGRQPMSDATGRWHIVFNGEIYNYLELRAELEGLGHAFRSGTDTEVLLHAFIEWDRAALTRFVGMFAFAVLDTLRGRVFLARDFFGIKPLYYAWAGELLVFASEIKALLGCPGVRRTLHPGRLYEYLRYGLTDHGGETLLEQVQQLPPGHYLDLERDRGWAGKPVQYWKPTVGETIDVSFDEAADHVQELFLENVRLHLRSDVPVGAALSGGIDSSAIVAAMRAVEPRLELHAFSYIADRADLSEERWIDIAATRAGAVLHKIRATPEELVDDLDRVVDVQDEPFGGTSIYAQHRVFRAARAHGIPVMLDGQGADEMLAGYRVFFVTRLASLLRRGGLKRAWRFLNVASHYPGSGGKARMAAQCLGRFLPPRLRMLGMALAGRDLMPAWMNRTWFAQHEVAASSRARAPARSLGEHLEQALAETSLPMLLRYEDRNSMAYSIESRVPFLTVPLTEYLLRLPEEYLIGRDGTTKNVFRQAMRGLVPDEILDRRDKIGFATPEQQWLLHLKPWVEKTLHSEYARSIPCLNTAALNAEWQVVLAGKWPFDARVWRWVNFIRWAERAGVEFDSSDARLVA
jgi:asparagine synthase (glutamine-hydrolysing)